MTTPTLPNAANTPASPPVPDTLELLLTPEWLTAALAQRFPGIEVTAVVPGPAPARITTNARFTIECAGGVPAGLAPDLCAKGYFNEVGRPIAHIGEPEAQFYKHLADATGVHTLRSVYADVHPDTRHGVVISEDVIAQGGTFLSALSPYSADQLALSLEQLARLHAATGEGTPGTDAPWLASRLHSYLDMRGVAEIQANYDGPVGVGVPDEVRDAQRLADAFGVYAARDATEGGWSVIHGDAHVGNLFLDAAGKPGLVDWQLVQRGHWATDVGYHIGTALDTPDRERHERDLLAHYLDRRRAFGAEVPSWDDAWTDYRKGIAYGLFMWAITLLVDEAIITTLISRLSAAVAANDSFEALGV